ncbi:MAG: 1-acyl-sn-glycerol-3-phosphate acyltransferase [Lachnospiraceae bacterium]|nr:1-acyl-sn-glycerol-3-phosphate acyltransferase [Lachnospiraceae bacterium]
MNRIALAILKNFYRFPWAYGKLCRYAKNTDRYPEQEKYDHIQYMMKKLVKDGNIDLQVYGKESLPDEDGFMFYGNHQGLFDIVALVAAYDRPFAGVFKKELKNIPLLKQIVACTGSHAMDREDVRQSMKVIMKVTEEVKGGKTIAIFPEGTRSRNGNEMLEFHSGSFKCALKSKCKIVPLAYVDSYKVLDQKGSKPVSVQLHFLPVIEYDEYKDMNTKELANLVHKRIEDKIKEVTQQ